MELHNETKVGTMGWAALALGVLAWDVFAEETLTNAFRRGLECRWSRPLCLGAVAVTGAHLLGYLPDAVDPFDRAGDVIRIAHGTLAKHGE